MSGLQSKPLRRTSSLPSLTYRSAADVDLVELEKQFNADKDAIMARGNALKFAVSGNGTFVDVSVEFQSKSFSFGKATSIKKGDGSFLAKHVVVGIFGAYSLTIDDKAGRVSKNTEQIWFWSAEREPEKGILGEVDIVFNSKTIAALAGLLASLYN